MYCEIQVPSGVSRPGARPVDLDRLLGDAEPVSDVPVAQSRNDEIQDLALTIRQALETVAERL